MPLPVYNHNHNHFFAACHGFITYVATSNRLYKKVCNGLGVATTTFMGRARETRC